MKKQGFNTYGNIEDGQGEESSFSEPSRQQNPPTQAINYAFMNQFANFSPGSGFSEGMIVTLFQIVEQQSQALQALMGKVELITQRTVELTEKIKQLKKNKQEERDIGHIQVKKQTFKNETLKAGGDILQASSLIKILFGSEKRYQYKLQLAEKLELPLYRQRNFFLQIELCDLQGRKVKNSNKIPLSLALYSSENPPKFIEKNTAGQKILKGYIQQSLHQGICRFQKIQIKEVTSHFRNGWVFIVIIPSMTPLGSASTSSQSFIDYTKIQPLVLQKIVVKAKKLKQTRKEDEQIDKNAAAQQMDIEDQPRNQDPDQIYSQQK